MSIAEGTHRLRLTGQWVVLLTSIGFLVGLAIKFPLLGIGELLVALFGVALWLASWIIEGFAKRTV